jgi:hypothetical protein
MPIQRIHIERSLCDSPSFYDGLRRVAARSERFVDLYSVVRNGLRALGVVVEEA